MLPEIIPNWHPLFVHFTIALFSVATMFMILGSIVNLKYKETILNVAYINLWVGCLFTIATVLVGFYAYNTVAHDEPSHMAMTKHRNWAIPTAISFWILGIWSIKLFKNNDKTNKIFITLITMASLALAVTGWKGGEAVYRYGLGVMSLPNTDSHQHEGGESEPHEDMPMKEGHDMGTKNDDLGMHNNSTNPENPKKPAPNSMKEHDSSNHKH